MRVPVPPAKLSNHLPILCCIKIKEDPIISLNQYHMLRSTTKVNSQRLINVQLFKSLWNDQIRPVSSNFLLWGHATLHKRDNFDPTTCIDPDCQEGSNLFWHYFFKKTGERLYETKFLSLRYRGPMLCKTKLEGVMLQMISNTIQYISYIHAV